MLEQMDQYIGKKICIFVLGNREYRVKLLSNTPEYLVCSVKGFSDYYVLNIMKSKIVSFHEILEKMYEVKK